MQPSLTVSLSPPLLEWVEVQAAQRGFISPGDFVSDLVRREHEEELSRQLDRRLNRSMQTLVSGMTDGNWADVRKAGRTRARRHD
jgi:hypothetical protein